MDNEALAKIAFLIAENQALRDENQKLRAENQELRNELQLLRKEIQELREKLNTNSKNSSKPPSQDPHRGKSRSKPSGRRPGGQPGHRGHSRKIFSSEEVSQMIDVRPDLCPNCSATEFDIKPVSIELRQVVELPQIVPEVTQYNIYTCKCGTCGKHVRADVPKEAERGFGPRLMGFVTMLTGEGHVTKRKICSISAHLGLKISLGALCNIHKLAGEILEGPSQVIQKFVLKQENLNADESSWRIRNKRHWIWIGATPNATFFKIDPSRGQVAYQRIYGCFKGILGTDRHSAYNEHEGPKQSCLGHIDRHFEKVSERPGIDGSIGRVLGEQLDLIFGLWAQFKRGMISRTEMQKGADEHVKSIKAALVLATEEATFSKTKALAYDLLSRYETLWTFLTVEGVEPTNNLAERGLRPAVIWRKLSFGNQSEWGARFTERLFTLVCTLKQNAKNVFEFLTQSFQAHLGRGPPPLVPLSQV